MWEGKKGLGKKSCRRLTLAAPGREMPASELKTISYRWPINRDDNNDRADNNDSSGCLLPRKNSLPKGGWITNEAAQADTDMVVAAWKADSTSVSKTVAMLMTHS